MADLTQLSVGELRRKLRAEHPECRGSFATLVDKDAAIQILEGKLEGKTAVANFFQSQANAVAEGTAAWHTAKALAEKPTDEPLAEGIHAEPAAIVNDPVYMPMKYAGMEKVLKALDSLDPKAAESIRDCQAEVERQLLRSSELERALNEALEQAASSKPVAAIEKAGGTVKIHKTDSPVVLDAADERMVHVPAADNSYRFDYWRAERRCGAVLFRQSCDDVFKCILAGHRVLLVGPPAVGKTSLIVQWASRCQWPLVRFNGNRDVTVQDFVGCYEARNGSTIWTDGPLPLAMKIGAVLVLDEVDHMPAECSSVLHSPMEPNGHLCITANGGEIVKPHPNFRIVATANSAGFGDESGLHPNAQVQDAALLSRFGVVFRVTWMAQKHEKKLITGYGIGADEAELMVRVAHDTRKAADTGTLQYPVTLRQTMAWAQTAKMLGSLSDAFAITVLNSAPNTDAAALAEIAQRHLGDKLQGVTEKAE